MKRPWLERIIERTIARNSLVGDQAIFDRAEFPWTRDVESQWPVIRKELDELLKEREFIPSFQTISKEQEFLTNDNKWKTLVLYAFGEKFTSNCLRCPETTRLLEQIPGMQTAIFSILAPGKHIPEHRGVYKGVLRYHLALKVPRRSEGCRIRIVDEHVHWEEGRGLMFDDTYLHEVWNDSDEERVVLILDIERPCRPLATWFNRKILRIIRASKLVQEGTRRQLAWERQVEQWRSSRGEGDLSAEQDRSAVQGV